MKDFLPENYSRLDGGVKYVAILNALRDLGFQYHGDAEWLTLATKSFNRQTVVQVFVLAQILAENQPITVRGAMYRTIGILWKDSADETYRKCSRLLLQIRRLGLLSRSWIVDGTRHRDKPSSWSGLASFAETVASAYRKDLWERQRDYIESSSRKTR